MRLLFLIIAILIFVVNVKAEAKPFQRNAITNRYVEELSFFLGRSVHTAVSGADGLWKTTWEDGYVVNETKIMGERCFYTFFFNAKDAITDIEISTDACMGNERKDIKITPQQSSSEIL